MTFSYTHFIIFFRNEVSNMWFQERDGKYRYFERYIDPFYIYFFVVNVLIYFSVQYVFNVKFLLYKIRVFLWFHVYLPTILQPY